jgi:hypothetical protein
MGIRAAMVILLNYYNKYNLDTVWIIINRWAPNTENPTFDYAVNVAKHMNVGVNDEINLLDRDTMILLLEGMIHQENGDPASFRNWIYKDCPFWYNKNVFISAWEATA